MLLCRRANMLSTPLSGMADRHAYSRMRILVTGSSGHLGEALVRSLRSAQHEVIGLDILPSAFTSLVGTIADRSVVRKAMAGVQRVFHAATLHKPHVATHSRQAFIDVNITGTLNLLEEAVAARVESFVYTSTTSVFGDALVPPRGAPAAWITEDVEPVPKNIYGVSKRAAEDLCQLAQRNQGLPCVVLRTSRFFPEADDDAGVRGAYGNDNQKVNEFLNRRVDIEDVVTAHILASERARVLKFGRYIVSATTPFMPTDMAGVRSNLPGVLRERIPRFVAEYEQRGWQMAPSIDRVYVNARARSDLGWEPRFDFAYALARLMAGENFRSELALAVGSKGYHGGTTAVGDGAAGAPYPIDHASAARRV